ncbi:hypothetical protein [Gordonia alkanivorans]|uniref:Uncharacterized protein n=2 Tax=root TaxID=1 RepID=A0A159B6C9_9CAUD|nr:hypothetical protein [Gordonia alkanivorans]YP_009324422.1 hypothetical protein BOX05_gp30 [Gordonia phage GAL1]AKJ72045.1 hypothetical protein GAL1_30 [Gordonia phage GAL1]GAA13813.1 hypothetical protein GOALK_093_00010 [Gordonia alkanivorans NBRC 16433]
MAQTLVLRSPDASFTGPKLYADPRLNAGSLVLVDATHAAGPWGAGVPTSLPNLAADPLRSLLATTDGTAALSIANTVSAATGMVERTAKGGLHVIAKKTGTVAGESVLAHMSTQLQEYLNANSTHALYLSAWARATRARTIGSGPTAVPVAGLRREHSTVHTGWLSAYYASSGNVATNPGTTSPNYINRTIGALSSGVGSYRVALGITGRNDTVWGASVLSSRLIELGNVMTGNEDHAPSTIVYACQLVDLTVAAAELGLSVAQAYDEADAIDAAEYAAAFGTGGRYASDTFTDPTTI